MKIELLVFILMITVFLISYFMDLPVIVPIITIGAGLAFIVYRLIKK